jgi:hypothetical protein
LLLHRILKFKGKNFFFEWEIQMVEGNIVIDS